MAQAPATARRGEIAVGLGTMAFAAAAAWQASLIPSEGVGSSIGPHVIPWAVTGMLALFGAALAAEALLARGAPAEDDHGAIDARGAAWMLLGLALNVALIEHAGFIISSTLLFVCTARAFGSTRLARDGAIGLVLALVAYVGFDRLLGYKIGTGLIERLI